MAVAVKEGEYVTTKGLLEEVVMKKDFAWAHIRGVPTA
jgi:hypothetical protein